MPFSRPDARPWVTKQVRKLRPATILDVGAGAGTYWQALHNTVKAHWTAIEIHEPYVQRFGLTGLYDEVIVGDFLTEPLNHYDLVILGDVLEHVDEGQAGAMVAKALAIGRVIAVVPVDHFEQGESHGNPHEAHLWHPTHEQMLTWGPVDSWTNGRKGAYLW